MHTSSLSATALMCTFQSLPLHQQTHSFFPIQQNITFASRYIQRTIQKERWSLLFPPISATQTNNPFTFIQTLLWKQRKHPLLTPKPPHHIFFFNEFWNQHGQCDFFSLLDNSTTDHCASPVLILFCRTSLSFLIWLCYWAWTVGSAVPDACCRPHLVAHCLWHCSSQLYQWQCFPGAQLLEFPQCYADLWSQWSLTGSNKQC